MSQRLVLPINSLEVTAGFKNENYRKSWGWVHYGMDCVNGNGDRTVYACGDGEVIASGMDGSTLTGSLSRLGNVIVIVYKDVLCNDGVVRDLASRMYHFNSVKVKTGDKVSKNTIIGMYGNTGANTSGAHLHIEFDADVNYPCYAKGVKDGGKIIIRGTIDSLVNPSQIWFVDNNQTISGRKYSGSLCYIASDVIAPKIPENDSAVSRKEFEGLKSELKSVKLERDKYKTIVDSMRKLLE